MLLLEQSNKGLWFNFAISTRFCDSFSVLTKEEGGECEDEWGFCDRRITARVKGKLYMTVVRPVMILVLMTVKLEVPHSGVCSALSSTLCIPATAQLPIQPVQ